MAVNYQGFSCGGCGVPGFSVYSVWAPVLGVQGSLVQFGVV